MDYHYNQVGRLDGMHLSTDTVSYRYYMSGRLSERTMPDNIINQYIIGSLGRSL